MTVEEIRGRIQGPLDALNAALRECRMEGGEPLMGVEVVTAANTDFNPTEFNGAPYYERLALIFVDDEQPIILTSHE